MKFIALSLFVSVFAVISCHRQPEKSLTIQLQGKDRKLTLSELKSLIPPQEIAVDDYYLKRKITYRSFSLIKLLKAFIAEAADFDELIFRCADGYLAHVTRADLDAGKLNSFHLAFGEGADEFKSLIPQGKAELSPEPFYAVATDPRGFATLSWPYELIAIEFVNFRKLFPGLYFAGLEKNPEVKRGFDIFRKECLKCHSLNLQGGDIGPELNVPKNITEYRDEKFLREFIRNASSFRAKSKMPAFPHLTETDLQNLISYLRGAKGAKPP